MRRIHLPEIVLGRTDLSDAQSRYLRDVLRLCAGDPIEVFGDAGMVGHGSIAVLGRGGVTIEITRIQPGKPNATDLIVAAAIPKAQRADWMIEKLAELGVSAFFPLIAQRQVVLPKGDKKFDRWKRLAEQASRQSGRASVMVIHPITSVGDLLAESDSGVRWYLSVREDAKAMIQMLTSVPPRLTLLIGPEGGWTDEEIAGFEAAGVIGVRLTHTILRVETAALAAAALAASAQAGLTDRAAGESIGDIPHRKIS
jgi:16S rRNA (uracil1498-N3)-methyltransferase